MLPKDNNPDLTYESVYLFDTQSYFGKLAKITEEQSAKYSKQNAIVVGISSENDRDRDFTPTVT